ncbi:MAG: LLM class F420-dependent oxidoreductase, partial [Dehalococcoidia bacterium]
MKVGLSTPLVNPFATPEYIRTLGTAAEDRGFHSIWVPEHVVLFDSYESVYPYADTGKIPIGPESGVLDPFVVLSNLAAVTSRIRLGTGICLLPQRNPVYTAKEAATVDWLSNGRLDLGIGVGWLREEFEALHVPFERRGERCDAYIEVMRALWCDEVSQYESEFYSLPPTRQYPKPVQQPHVPVHIGGHSNAALRRVAEHGQGWYAFNQSPEEMRERLAKLDQLLEARGRTRSEIQVGVCPYTVPADAGVQKGYEDAGVDEVTLHAVARDEAGLIATLDG